MYFHTKLPTIQLNGSKCDICGKKLLNPLALKCHLKNVHSVKYFSCKICK